MCIITSLSFDCFDHICFPAHNCYVLPRYEYKKKISTKHGITALLLLLQHYCILSFRPFEAWATIWVEGCFILISSAKTILPLNLLLFFLLSKCRFRRMWMCCDIYSCDCTWTTEDKILELVLIHTKQKRQWETKITLFWKGPVI